jgi:aminoglycoside phosphotransferase family enzyme/predicted kinase
VSALARHPLIEALTNPQVYPDGVTEVRLAETHISWVFLTGRYAYKIKKPVKLPFLDFSTLERRRYFCEQELTLNRRLAKDLYLAVVPIGGTPEQPAVEVEPAIEYAVKMLQFPDDALLDRRVRANDVPVAVLRDFAIELARFHAQLPDLTDDPQPQLLQQTVQNNLAELRELGTSAFAAEIAAVDAWTRAEGARIARTLSARLAGKARKECHGDLHLQNLVLLDGKVVAFDALEFDPRLREIDVVSEASFPTMDLLAHRRPDLAYAFMAEYLESGGDYDGLEVLRFYLTYHAMIRAKVVAVKAQQAKTRQADGSAIRPYVALAQELITARRPLVLITHGLSGSGKTHITSELIARLPALRVRSDLERKRTAGVAANAPSGSAVGGGLYTADASAATYQRLSEIAAAAVRNHFDIIVDATFLRRRERDLVARAAAVHGARFAILDCVAAPQTLRQRIAARAAAGGDASEATLAVLDLQLRTGEPLARTEQAAAVTVDTDEAPDYDALTKRLLARA